MSRWTDTGRVVLGIVFAASSCLAQVKPVTMRVDVNNFVLYNYDTFDTTQFGTNSSATNVMMKTYNYHVSIGDIVAVNGTSVAGTLLCTHTMFVLSPTAVAATSGNPQMKDDETSENLFLPGRVEPKIQSGGWS